MDTPHAILPPAVDATSEEAPCRDGDPEREARCSLRWPRVSTALIEAGDRTPSAPSYLIDGPMRPLVLRPRIAPGVLFRVTSIVCPHYRWPGGSGCLQLPGSTVLQAVAWDGRITAASEPLGESRATIAESTC